MLLTVLDLWKIVILLGNMLFMLVLLSHVLGMVSMHVVLEDVTWPVVVVVEEAKGGMLSRIVMVVLNLF